MCPGGQVVKQKHLVGDRDGRHAGDGFGRCVNCS